MQALRLWQSLVGTGVLLTVLIVVLVVPGLSSADNQTPAQLRAEQERPDNPPGRPAMSMTGERLAPPTQFSTFVIHQVNVGPNGFNILEDAANEPSIAVDPTNPNRMAIGWRQFDTILSNFRQAGYGYTTDGGRTWTFPGVIDGGIFRSDPVLDFDRFGVFYYNSLKVVGSNYTCDVFRSFDGGATWPVSGFAYGGDKQWMTIDRTGGGGDGFIYQACSIYGNNYTPNQFNRSIDGGQTFSSPITIPSSPIWGTLSVGPGGVLYVSGVDPNDSSNFLIAKSSNAQLPFGTPSFDFTVPVDLGGSIRFSAGSLSPNPGGLLGQVWVATDHSGGPTDGNVYMLCSVDPPGVDPLDIHFARSTDGGVTWSAPVKVNDDPENVNHWQWFGTMSVAPNGRIDAIWNDTRTGNTFSLSELYYSYSTDGGLTWAANVQLSPIYNSHLGWPQQDKLGDYYDMVSDDVGANIAWAATFNGEQDVYYTRINDYDCNANGVGDTDDIANGTSYDQNQDGIPDECQPGASAIPGDVVMPYHLYQNVPNPFNPTTTIAFDVPESGGAVTLQIFDVKGRLVRTLVDGFEGAGSKSVTWAGRDDRGRLVSSGVYFYRLEAPGFAQTRKLVLMK